MALAEPAQHDLANGDFSLDRNRDAWRLLCWVFCRGRACQAWVLRAACLVAVRENGIFDPCVRYRGLGCAVQRAPPLPCNERNDSLRPVPSPMQAKTLDREDRQARRAERSSRSSTRTLNGSKRQPESCLYHYPKLIDILFNSFTCDAVPGLSGISWI